MAEKTLSSQSVDDLKIHYSTAFRIWMPLLLVASTAVIANGACAQKTTLLGRIALSAFAFALAAASLWAIRECFLKRVLLVLNSEGLTDFRTKIHIPLSEIESAQAYDTKSWGLSYPRRAMRLSLYHPDKVIGQKSLTEWSGMMMPNVLTERVRMDNSISLFLFRLDVSPDDLVEAINERLKHERR
jgi:hypothetical protein